MNLAVIESMQHKGIARALVTEALELGMAQAAMRAVLESAGVTDVLAKSKGSSNPHNVVKATLDALSRLRNATDIAKVRGISVDKVYNG